MSSPDRFGRFARLPAAAAMLLLLAGCFRPVYAPLPSGGTLRDVMATIDVHIIPNVNQERVAHYVENELAFDLDGSGTERDKKFRLELRLTESLITSSVNAQTGQATTAILTLTGDYKLFPSGSDQPVTSGKAVVSTSYDRTPQRFVDVRAARDAQIRAAKQLAEQMQARMAAFFASRIPR